MRHFYLDMNSGIFCHLVINSKSFIFPMDKSIILLITEVAIYQFMDINIRNYLKFSFTYENERGKVPIRSEHIKEGIV